MYAGMPGMSRLICRDQESRRSGVTFRGTIPGNNSRPVVYRKTIHEGKCVTCTGIRQNSGNEKRA
jgi:hypothetical protein